MFTSIGKKVITTTTAAFDCQSKPNHITMIGAMPMIGSAETKLPSGSSPRRRNGHAIADDRHRRSPRRSRWPSRPAPPSGRSGRNPASRIGSEVAKPGADRRGRRHQHGRNAEADAGDLPQANTDEPEQQRRQRCRARARVSRRSGIEASQVVQPPGRAPRRAQRRRPEQGRHRAGPGMRPADQRPRRRPPAPQRDRRPAQGDARLMAALPWPVAVRRSASATACDQAGRQDARRRTAPPRSGRSGRNRSR